MRKIIGRNLAASFLLIFLAGCASVTPPPAPVSIVKQHANKIAEYDHLANYLDNVTTMYGNANLLNSEIVNRVRLERDVAYVYYWHANILLAEGNIEGYERYINQAIKTVQDIQNNLDAYVKERMNGPTT